MKTITKTDAPTLDALCELLNNASEARRRWDRAGGFEPDVLRVEEIYDTSALPIYGDLDPKNTDGIYSWDDERVLVCCDDHFADRPWSVEVVE